MDFHRDYVVVIDSYLREFETLNYYRSKLYSMRLKTVEYIGYIGLNEKVRDKFCSIFDSRNLNFVSLYTIASAYKEQREENFENFCAISEDCSSVVNYDGWIISDFLFHEGIDLINNIVSNRDYKNMPNLRRCLIGLFKAFEDPGEFSLYRRIAEEVERLRIDYLRSNCNYDEYNKVLNYRLGLWLDNKEIDEDFYERFLLKGNRYFYINDKLKEVIESPRMRKIIFSKISSIMNDDVYARYFSFDSTKDYFIKYMDCVFDSDSYYELFNKLDILEEASRSYSNRDEDLALALVNGLNDDKYKYHYNNQVIAYPKNSINMIDRPKTILEREKSLYSKIDGSVSYDFMDDLIDNFSDVDSFYDSFLDGVKREKSVIVKAKKRLNFFRKRY